MLKGTISYTGCKACYRGLISHFLVSLFLLGSFLYSRTLSLTQPSLDESIDTAWRLWSCVYMPARGPNAWDFSTGGLRVDTALH